MKLWIWVVVILVLVLAIIIGISVVRKKNKKAKLEELLRLRAGLFASRHTGVRWPYTGQKMH